MTDFAQPQVPRNELSGVSQYGLAGIPEPAVSHETVTGELLFPSQVPELGAQSVSIESGVVNSDREGRIKRAVDTARRAIEWTILAAEITPANEVMRFGAFGAVMAEGASPLVGGLVLGATTLAIEGAAAISTSDLLNTPRGARMFERAAAGELIPTEHTSKVANWIAKKVKVVDRVTARLNKLVASEKTMSPLVEGGVAYWGGSAVVLAEKQREDPTRTIGENVRHGLFTTGWLATVLTAQGTMAAEGIHTPGAATISVGLFGVASVPGALKWAKRRGQRGEVVPDKLTDRDRRGEYRIITDETSLEKAAVIEQQVWDEEEFGNLKEVGYGPHIDNSRTFACFKGEDCIGVTRMFRGKQEEDDILLPPFLSLPFDDEVMREYLAEKCLDGTAEELGTTAVVNSERGKGVNTRMWRLAYRDAVARGVDTWAIIMEPERVEKMNKAYGFTFQQVGPALDYQGGDCAVHVMNLEEVRVNMRNRHPLTYYWFAQKPLKSK